VDDDRIHADEAQQRDVAREAFPECGIGHGAAAEADDQGRRVERPDERQRASARMRAFCIGVIGLGAA
jgi:hypothetical protein